LPNLRGGAGNLLGSATILASGHAVACLLLIAAAPILSRLYSPECFGVLSVFTACAAAMSAIATLRFDQAIVLPRRDSEATVLMWLSCLCAMATAAILLMLAAVFGGTLNNWSREYPMPQGIVPFLAASVATSAVYQITAAWLVRKRSFKELAQMRVIYAVAALIAQFATPFFVMAGPAGLVAGQIAGLGFAGLYGARRVCIKRMPWSCFRRCRVVAFRYRNYPLYDSWAALMSSLGLLAPAALLAILFNAEVAGWFTLAQRVLAMPTTMISNSMSRVYYAEAARVGALGRPALRELFKSTLRQVMLLAGLPIIGGAFVAPFVFAPLFGSQWQTAGVYLSLISPMILSFALAFVLAPTLDVVGQQRMKMLRELICLTLICCGVAVPRVLGWSPMSAVATMSSLATFGYLLALAIAWSALSENRTKRQEHVSATPDLAAA
jgi:O-antigen/teichoic acid export membrane protein